MSITKSSTSGLLGTKTSHLDGSSTPDPTPSPIPVDPYVRPADWLALPAVNGGNQKMVGLVAVFNADNNWVSLTVAGAYTVDWGDGTSPQNFAASTRADHNYSYAAVGNLSTLGYKQAIVTVTMQGASNLTWFDLSVVATGVVSGYTSLWLDIRMAGANLTTFSFSNVSANARMLQQFEYVGPSSLTGSNGTFTNCSALRNMIGTEWTSGRTSFANFFSSCSSLTNVPLFNTSSGTTFASMFNACSSLKTIPLINTAAGITFNNMFSSCSSLLEIPLLNTSAGTNFSSMFGSCSSLQTIPLINTAAGTTFASMFNACPTLQTIPLLNTGAGLDFSIMFQSCGALSSIPLLNTAAGTNFTSMFNTCRALVTVPLLVTSAGITFTNMFNACSALQTIPLLNTSAGTTFTTMFATCTSLQVGAMSGTSRTISYASCKLSGTQLDAIYTNLASGVVAQTITVSTNIGTATDTPSIATTKGWTVTGS